jgi:ParB family chromosome partitioning protein
VSKKGLGRGLSALIPERETSENEIKEISLDDILPNPEQPRREFDEDKLKELADSIKQHGLLQPILVKPEGNKYHIIAGERRYRACRLAGLKQISCIVKECSQQEMTEKALIENIQRDDLSPVEEGMAYARLIEEYGLTQEQLAKRVGKGRPTITNLLRIIQLPSPILEMINNGQISLGHAKVLLTITNPEEQVLLAQKIVIESLSVRELENYIQGNSEPKTTNKRIIKPRKPKYNVLVDIEEKLRSSFQTKVSVKGDKEKGKIEIEYYSNDELNRLLEKWRVEI